MGNRCFKITTKGLNSACGSSGTYTTTINNVTSLRWDNRTVSSGNYNGCKYDFLVVDNVSRFPDLSGGSAPGTGVITEISCSGGQTVTDKYDCLNGACVNSVSSGTPGTYTDLATCQANCGSNACSADKAALADCQSNLGSCKSDLNSCHENPCGAGLTCLNPGDVVQKPNCSEGSSSSGTFMLSKW